MDHIDEVCLWLAEEAAKRAKGSSTIANVILQVLESTLMPMIVNNQSVRKEMLDMLSTRDPGNLLECINIALLQEIRTSELIQAYICTLHQKHDNCDDPPFGPMNSRLWYYQDWDTVSHFNNLLVVVT